MNAIQCLQKYVINNDKIDKNKTNIVASDTNFHL